MNLHQLNVFRSIVETGSFSRAAAQLRIAQSAVSYHVKALEDEVGRPLFLRYKTRISLTEGGRKLWEHVDKIFLAVEEARRDVCAAPGASELHFGLGVSSLCDQLPGFAARLREKYPSVCFHVAMGSTPQIVSLLRANTLDLGVISLPVSEPEISTTPLFYEEEDMLVVLPSEHLLAGRTELSPHDLRGLPLVLYHKNTATRASLDGFFHDAGFTPLVFMEIDREDAILELVRSGLGVTILPRCVFGHRTRDERLRFVRLQNAYLRREVGVAVHNVSRRSELVSVAIAFCRQRFRGAIAGLTTDVSLH
jgi:DNA-binding transcriptional LysR family regulator